MRIGLAPFSLRDIAVHLIPGAILLTLILWFLDGFVGLIINLLTLGTGAVSLVLWLVAAYAAGIFVLLFSKFLTGENPEEREARLAAQFVDGNDGHFSAEFKRELMTRAQKVFGGAAAGKELFVLCRDFVAQHRAARRAAALSAYGELYRGMLATVRIALVVSALMVLKHVVLLFLPQFNVNVPVTGFVDFETVHLLMGILVLIIAAASVRLLKARIEFCTAEAVSDVYTSFVALAAMEK